MGANRRQDELSSTAGVAPVTVPMGSTPNYGGKEKKKEKEPEVWDDQKIIDIRENIIKNIKKLK